MARKDIYIQKSDGVKRINPHTASIIKRAIRAALDFEGFDAASEISVTLTDNAGIRRLNAEYRNIDRETDVLSFPLLEGEDAAEFDDGEPVALGDIVISLERAKEQAKEYGHGIDREIAFLCVHSVLHLLGYDHVTSPEDEREMFSRQEEILKTMGLERRCEKASSEEEGKDKSE